MGIWSFDGKPELNNQTKPSDGLGSIDRNRGVCCDVESAAEPRGWYCTTVLVEAASEDALPQERENFSEENPSLTGSSQVVMYKRIPKSVLKFHRVSLQLAVHSGGPHILFSKS